MSCLQELHDRPLEGLRTFHVRVVRGALDDGRPAVGDQASEPFCHSDVIGQRCRAPRRAGARVEIGSFQVWFTFQAFRLRTPANDYPRSGKDLGRLSEKRVML